MTDHVPITLIAKPQVERSRGLPITKVITDPITPITKIAKPQAERSRTDHATNHAQAITNPTVPLGTGVQSPGQAPAHERKTQQINPSTIAALSVPCPSCRARPGERCRTAKRSGVHTPRVQRGLQKTRNDEYRQHERAARAQGRVPQAIAAGCTPVDSDITTALACTCSDCQLGELVLLVGPVLMGAAR